MEIADRLRAWHSWAPLRRLAPLGVALALLASGAASALPLSYTVAPGSTMTGDVIVTLEVLVHSGSTIYPGGGTLTGALASDSTGGAVVDWGHPGLPADAIVHAADIENPDPGNVTGNVTVSGIPFLSTITLVPNLTVDFIDLSLADPPVGPFALDAASLPDGPWTMGPDDIEFELTSQIHGTASGTGLLSFLSFDLPLVPLGPTETGPIPVSGTLSRLFDGLDEVGTQLIFSGEGIGLILGPFETTNVPVNQCFGGTVFGVCAGIFINSIDVTITSLEFSDVEFALVMTNAEVMVPEPGTALLLGLGAAALALSARRRARV